MSATTVTASTSPIPAIITQLQATMPATTMTASASPIPATTKSTSTAS
jgi:hypothetical protein